MFGVRQIDAAGNGSDTPSRAFSVDLTPPAAPAVVSGPEGATTDPSPAFAFNADAGTLVECRLDGPSGPGAFQPCASPLSFSGLAPGDYTLFIRSTDAAGNRADDPALLHGHAGPGGADARHPRRPRRPSRPRCRSRPSSSGPRAARCW